MVIWRQRWDWKSRLNIQDNIILLTESSIFVWDGRASSWAWGQDVQLDDTAGKSEDSQGIDRFVWTCIKMVAQVTWWVGESLSSPLYSNQQAFVSERHLIPIGFLFDIHTVRQHPSLDQTQDCLGGLLRPIIIWWHWLYTEWMLFQE